MLSPVPSQPLLRRVVVGCCVGAGFSVLAACSEALGPATSIEITPDPATVQVGGLVQLTVVLRNIDSIPLSGLDVTWSSSDESTAMVDEEGTVSGIAEGEATITAMHEGLTAAVSVTVTQSLVPVDSVEVTPAQSIIAQGGSVKLKATLRNASDEVVTGRPVTWESSDPTIAPVDATGLVGGLAEGTVTITATSEGVSGTAMVTVATVNASHPNEPAGAITLNDWPFDWSSVRATGFGNETPSQPWYGIFFDGGDGVTLNRASTVSDPTAPLNPSIVGRIEYSPSVHVPPFGNGAHKPVSADQFVPPQGFESIYQSYYFKFSDNFFLAAAELKHNNQWNTSDASAVILEMRSTVDIPGDGWPLPTHPPYLLEIRVAENTRIDTKVGQRGVFGNPGGTEIFIDRTPYVQNNEWYFVETLVNYQTGEIKIWLGTPDTNWEPFLVAHGVSSLMPLGEMFEQGFEGTYGGQCVGCAPIPETMYFYQGGSFYMSYTMP